MRIPFVAAPKVLTKIQSWGLTMHGDSVTEAKQVLLDQIQVEMPEVSDVYSLDSLMEFYEILFVPIRETPHPSQIWAAPQATLAAHKTLGSQSYAEGRKKVRLNLQDDPSYIIPLLDHLNRYPQLEVQEIRTGMAVKFNDNGYMCNMLNYNEPRTIRGVMHGNLYFNLIRTDADFGRLNTNLTCQWFRKYAMVKEISIYGVLDILTEDNIRYLMEINRIANQRKRKNVARLEEIVDGRKPAAT